MPPRLRQQTLACIDQDHGQVGAGRTGGHVARVLLVPRAVGHDELAPRSTEITIGHVDGDALLALGFEAIDQQRVIERFALAAMAPAIRRQRRELVVVRSEEHNSELQSIMTTTY